MNGLAVSLVSLALLLLAGGAGVSTKCEPPDCSKIVAARAAVSLADPSKSELEGVWKNGDGLSGSFLYLFEDGSYINTQWADIEPETIYDKGHWDILNDVIRLNPDGDVVWAPRSDRRFLCLKPDEQDGYHLLGTDLAVGRFQQLSDEKPELGTGDEWLLTLTFRHERSLTLQQGRLLKTKLLQSSWKPDYFLPQP